jgi:hypothetical protein
VFTLGAEDAYGRKHNRSGMVAVLGPVEALPCYIHTYMLMEEHKMKRQAFVLTFLTRYSEQGDDFLSFIVTGDETWLLHVTPESKQQSMEWRHTSSPIKKKIQTYHCSLQDHMHSVLGQ